MVNIRELFNIKQNISINTQNLPRHVALTMNGSIAYANKNNISLDEIFKQRFVNVKNIIKICTKLNIPITTFYVLRNKREDTMHFSSMIDSIAYFFNSLLEWDLIKEKKIKISIIGKWYDLPDRVIEPIKKITSDTKDYDDFFVNFCINYNGQDEIVDACKLIVRQMQAEKLNPDNITKQTIKDNLYSSYFLPPDLIIKTGIKKSFGGLLLWDSAHSRIYLSNTLWPDFGKADFLKAVEWYQK